MKKRNKRFLLMLLTLAFSFGCIGCSDATYDQISGAEAKAIMDSESGYIIIDARTQSEYDQGHIPSAILILFANPIKCITFIIIIVILQQFDGNILGPKILGSTTGLSSFWVMFAILVGGGIFGIIGMFVGVPAFAVIYKFTKEYLEKKLESKNLPEQTESYKVIKGVKEFDDVEKGAEK